jgi:hexosaminidase
MEIEDFPDLPIRGVLIDIGRGKIPQMATLYHLIDFLADLKINHMQLYMEGYSFAYAKYAEFFPEEAPITGEELRELDRYAASRFIELVPCQNCLGHMEAWLTLPAFNALAEVPEGLSMVPGLPPQTTTLDPLDPAALELVQNLFDELLPNYSSTFVNINLDEPYELGRGKNCHLAEKEGIGQLYFDYLTKVLTIIRRHQKKAYLWGDVLLQYPELLDKLPEDVTVLDWLYEGKSSFEPHARILQAHQIPFVVCPGTSSWNSIAGRTDNMKANILNAAEVGIGYGAKGLVVTDWGDYGHWQTLPVSYAGYAYAAAYSWCLKENRDIDAADFLDTFVFNDADRVMGHFWQDLGNYYYYENAFLPNMTLTFLALSPLAKWDTRVDFHQKLNLYFQLIQTIAGVFGNYPFDAHTDYDYNGLKDFLKILRIRLELNQMRCDNREIVYREALYTLLLVGHGADLYQFAHEMTILPHLEIKERLATMLFDLGQILDAFFDLWPGRNRKGSSINRNAMGFHILMTRYQERLSQLESDADLDSEDSHD